MIAVGEAFSLPAGPPRNAGRYRYRKGGSMFAPIRSSLILALAAAAVPCRAEFQPARTPDLDQTIRAGVGITAYSLEPITPVIARGGGFVVTLDLGGRAYAAQFLPDATNSPDCQMVLEDGSATPAIVPAPPSSTYRGTIAGVPGSLCSGSLVNGQLTAVVILPGVGSWSVLPLTEVWPGADKTTHIVSSNDDVAPGPWH